MKELQVTCFVFHTHCLTYLWWKNYRWLVLCFIHIVLNICGERTTGDLLCVSYTLFYIFVVKELLVTCFVFHTHCLTYLWWKNYRWLVLCFIHIVLRICGERTTGDLFCVSYTLFYISKELQVTCFVFHTHCLTYLWWKNYRWLVLCFIHIVLNICGERTTGDLFCVSYTLSYVFVVKELQVTCFVFHTHCLTYLWWKNYRWLVLCFIHIVLRICGERTTGDLFCVSYTLSYVFVVKELQVTCFVFHTHCLTYLWWKNYRWLVLCFIHIVLRICGERTTGDLFCVSYTLSYVFVVKELQVTCFVFHTHCLTYLWWKNYRWLVLCFIHIVLHICGERTTGDLFCVSYTLSYVFVVKELQVTCFVFHTHCLTYLWWKNYRWLVLCFIHIVLRICCERTTGDLFCVSYTLSYVFVVKELQVTCFVFHTHCLTYLWWKNYRWLVLCFIHIVLHICGERTAGDLFCVSYTLSYVFVVKELQVTCFVFHTHCLTGLSRKPGSSTKFGILNFVPISSHTSNSLGCIIYCVLYNNNSKHHCLLLPKTWLIRCKL